MITAVHTLVYSDEPDVARSFFRDVLGWPHVDTGGGWLIFNTGPSELGVHPTHQDIGGESWSTAAKHEISLICDDIESTVADLESRGAVFRGEIEDLGFGLVTYLQVPGGPEIMVYEAKYDPPALSS